MIRLAILLGLVAFCAADEHCCSAEDRHIVQDQWKELWGGEQSSALKTGFARVLLLTLAERKPDVKPLFSAVDIDHPRAGKFSAHCMRVVNGLDMVIQLLDDPAALDQALDHLADQHHERSGVKKEHFDAMASILNDKLRRVFDKYDELAWRSCFSGVMRKIAGKLDA